jgi:hypothetical protein
LPCQLEESAAAKETRWAGNFGTKKFQQSSQTLLVVAQMDIVHSDAEADLFQACTTITIGDRVQTKFWQDRWLQGHAPREITPALHRFAWRKNISIAAGTVGGAWMKGLHRISTPEEINQVVHLWNMLQQVQLANQPDDITWRLSPMATTPHAQHSTSNLRGHSQTMNGKSCGNRRWNTNANFFVG